MYKMPLLNYIYLFPQETWIHILVPCLLSMFLWDSSSVYLKRLTHKILPWEKQFDINGCFFKSLLFISSKGEISEQNPDLASQYFVIQN